MDDAQDVTVGVRADTAGFAREVSAMRAELEGPLTAGADKAGRAISATLLSAARTGKLGFADLEKAALSALDSIASSALKSGLAGIVGGGSGAGGGLLSGLAGLFGGEPGRATGGPVTPGRAYMVGERGPELFVPTSSGRVETGGGGGGGGARDVRVSISVNARAGEAPAALQQSSRQIARAVRAALG